MTRRGLIPRLSLAVLLVTLAGCALGPASSRALPAERSSASRFASNDASPSTKLKHVVVIIQENRSVDNLFNGFCEPHGDCANTVTVDPVSKTPLQEFSLAAPFGAAHARNSFVTQYDNGKMDGFTQTPPLCRHKSCPYSIFAYVPASETQIYRELASVDGGFSDMTFETEQGPSFPAHLYAISGQSGGYDKDRYAISGGSGTCGVIKQVQQINMTTPYPGEDGPDSPSCKDFKTIFDLLANKGHSWRYYSNADASFFSATQSIQHLYNSPNFVVTSKKFLTDVAAGQLADVSFVMPWSSKVSDHPENVKDASAGPDWVASLVNSIGETPYWNNTAIVIWWDDWGGFFDHVPPPASPVDPDPFEYGFRVPLIVVSPYAKVGSIDHTPRTFVSALRLIEEVFHAGTLNTTDRYEPDGLNSMFDFNQKPIPYTPVGGSRAQPFAPTQRVAPAGRTVR